jgi:hypothetical protein
VFLTLLADFNSGIQVLFIEKDAPPKPHKALRISGATVKRVDRVGALSSRSPGSRGAAQAGQWCMLALPFPRFPLLGKAFDFFRQFPNVGIRASQFALDGHRPSWQIPIATHKLGRDRCSQNAYGESKGETKNEGFHMPSLEESNGPGQEFLGPATLTLTSTQSIRVRRERCRSWLASTRFRDRQTILLFKKGKLVRKVPIHELMDTLIQEVELLAKEKEAEGNGKTPASSNALG